MCFPSLQPRSAPSGAGVASNRHRPISTQMSTTTMCSVLRRLPPLKTSRTCTTRSASSTTLTKPVAYMRTSSRRSMVRMMCLRTKRKRKSMIRCVTTSSRVVMLAKTRTLLSRHISSGSSRTRSGRSRSKARRISSLDSGHSTASLPKMALRAILTPRRSGRIWRGAPRSQRSELRKLSTIVASPEWHRCSKNVQLSKTTSSRTGSKSSKRRTTSHNMDRQRIDLSRAASTPRRRRTSGMRQ